MSSPLLKIPEEWELWDRSHRLKLPAQFSLRTVGGVLNPDDLMQPEQVTDEYGLLWSLYRNYPARSRYYVSIALEFLKKPKNVSPQAMGVATIPELVCFGGLLRRNYRFNSMGPGSFFFQSEQMGGREVPGGAVIDFLVYVGNEKVGVRVNGKFHALDSPFYTGRQKVEEDRLQQIKLLARAGFTRLVDVNEAPRYFFEKGPDPMVEQEFRRIELGIDR